MAPLRANSNFLYKLTITEKGNRKDNGSVHLEHTMINLKIVETVQPNIPSQPFLPSSLFPILM